MPASRGYGEDDLALAACFAVAGVALAQGDFSGRWAPTLNEDWPERLPGPELGD